jgi:calcineurin-like phosphoesterase family protein
MEQASYLYRRGLLESFFMNKWFTADEHFGHENIIKFCNRPFKNASHMDAEMISRWNSVVTNKDYVYVIGDFTLNGEAFAYKIIRQLKAKKIFIIPGGHDRWIKNKDVPSDIKERLVICPPLYETRWRGNTIVMCHYPMLTWEKSHYGSIHLHGHSHGNVGHFGRSEEVRGLGQGTRIDIGVDMWDFTPVHADVVISYRKKNDRI